MISFRRITFFILWLTIFTIPWQKAFVISGVTSFNKIIGFSLAICVVFTVLMNKQIKNLPVFFYVLFVFIIINIVSFFISAHPQDTVDKILLYIQLAFLSWCIYEFTDNNKSVDRLLQAYVLGCFVLALQTSYLFFSGEFNSATRFTVEGYNLNHSGIIITLGLAISVYLLTINKKIYILYFPFAILTILLTGSRTAFLLLLIVALSSFIILMLSDIKFKKTIIVSIILIFIFIVGQIPQAQIDRITSTSHELTSGTLSGRTEIWESGIRVFTENPVLGVGSGTFMKSGSIYSSWQAASHNSYLSIIVENGIVGFINFSLLLILLLYYSFKILNFQYKWLFLTLMFLWLILSTASHAEAQKYTWIIFGIIISTYTINNKKSSQIINKVSEI